jgi:hypothetical protein
MELAMFANLIAQKIDGEFGIWEIILLQQTESNNMSNLPFS